MSDNMEWQALGDRSDLKPGEILRCKDQSYPCSISVMFVGFSSHGGIVVESCRRYEPRHERAAPSPDYRYYKVPLADVRVLRRVERTFADVEIGEEFVFSATKESYCKTSDTGAVPLAESQWFDPSYGVDSEED